ncbi:hypothetical protein ETD85_14065 [Nonomuraea zeae]|uniref:Type II toxin-antitoxin system HicA family toxin n=3 Tax=Nonomuraea zeae TaxID=1642303 RepID=A0A5S4GR64_9ACTN|nr:hypothetical protein ETD85_14065 [Nonomuraea zeae]
MRKRDLERRMRKLAKEYGVSVRSTEGGNHTKWHAGSEAMPVPRHSEVNERTAKGILEDWESILAEVAKEQEEQ